MSNGMTRREQEITDINEIIRILDEAKMPRGKSSDIIMPGFMYQ